ncbi:MAG: efflux RND transporter permease subunit, partial [Thermodesulfobacteriota bacterium]
MSWPLRHPVSIIPLFATAVFIGLLSWSSLPIDLLPSFSYPTLVVFTSYGQASPEEVEALVTRPIEAAIGTIGGLRATRSVSAAGASWIFLRFEWGEEMRTVAAEVREKLDAIADELPREAKPPLVTHYNPAEAPILILALHGPS